MACEPTTRTEPSSRATDAGGTGSAPSTNRPGGTRARRRVHGVPVTGVERTIADVVRAGGWTEQVDLAIRQALGRGQTNLPRFRAHLPKAWQARLRAAADAAAL